VSVVLKPQPLTRAAFAPYGDVIEMEGAHHYPINENTTERYHDLAAVDVAAESGRPLINFFRGQPRPRPIAIRLMERHPLGSQAFYPLQDRDYLVVVADPREKLAPATLRAFSATGRQGVNYARNVWHHPLLVLEPDSDFLVVDRGGAGENLDEAWFAESEKVFLEV
jgi:ureidoglycolate lyase